MPYLTDIELHDIIQNDIINPSILEEIKTQIASRNKWRKVSNVTETLGQLLIVASTILAFASGVYKCNDSLAFAAGCVGVASVSILKFSSYAANESIERSKLLNDLLSKQNTTLMPVVSQAGILPPSESGFV